MLDEPEQRRARPPAPAPSSDPVRVAGRALRARESHGQGHRSSLSGAARSQRDRADAARGRCSSSRARACCPRSSSARSTSARSAVASRRSRATRVGRRRDARSSRDRRRTRRRLRPATVAREGHALVWSFFEPKVTLPLVRDRRRARRRRRAQDAHASTSSRALEGIPEIHAGYDREDRAAPVRASARPRTRPTPSRPRIARPAAAAYTGRRIDLDLKDADIHNVLRLLADVGKRQHRHRRRRHRHRHDPDAQRALGSGARRRAPGQGPRHGAAGQPDPRRAARRAREGARAARSRGASRSCELAPLETRLIPVSYAQADELQDARARTCSRRAARSRSTSAPTCSSCATSPAT